MPNSMNCLIMFAVVSNKFPIPNSHLFSLNPTPKKLPSKRLRGGFRSPFPGGFNGLVGRHARYAPGQLFPSHDLTLLLEPSHALCPRSLLRAGGASGCAAVERGPCCFVFFLGSLGERDDIYIYMWFWGISDDVWPFWALLRHLLVFYLFLGVLEGKGKS